MTPEEYQAKRDARYQRLLAAAEKADRDSSAYWEQARKMASIIPMGQPILVGHYSEKSDRRYRERIDGKRRKGYDLHQKAEALRNRADAAASNNAIFSDDPQAGEKIAEKIERLEQRQAMMKQANKLVRKQDREGLAAMGFSDSQIIKLLTPDFCGRLGFPDYQITNNGANIRRLKQRITVIETKAETPGSETDIHTTAGLVTITDNADENRTQITFPDKPSAACRDDLKRNGFRWSPTAGTWQRHRSNWAQTIARQIVDKHYQQAEPEPSPTPMAQPEPPAVFDGEGLQYIMPDVIAQAGGDAGTQTALF